MRAVSKANLGRASIDLYPIPCVHSDVLLIATGSRPALDPLGPFSVDYSGTVNLITAAKAKGYKKVRTVQPMFSFDARSMVSITP